jgi:hypothetical protein
MFNFVSVTLRNLAYGNILIRYILKELKEGSLRHPTIVEVEAYG